jgi:HipA-like C-terminal domain
VAEVLSAFGRFVTWHLASDHAVYDPVTTPVSVFWNSPPGARPNWALIALSCTLRNGDAHLKNFGIVDDNVQGEARLAPVYDLVTPSVYPLKDSLH